MGTFDAGKGAAPRNSYDSEVPPNLLEFMLRSWRPRNARPPKALRDAAAFRSRRERLSRRFPGELLVIPTGHRKVRSNDTYYSFRPGTDFYYLTGALEPDCVLLLAPKGGTPVVVSSGLLTHDVALPPPCGIFQIAPWNESET